QPGDALAQIDQDRFGDDHFIRAENGGGTAQPGTKIVERQARGSDGGLPVERPDPGFMRAARAGAVGACLGGQEVVQAVAVMGSGWLQGGGVVVDVKEVPTSNGAIRDALLLVDQAFDVGLMDAAQPGAGWTGPGGFIKGEVSHADLWNRRATMWAGKGFFRSGGIVVRAGFTLPFRVGRVEGGRDIFSTGWAGAVSQASKQHAQIGIDIGGSAKRGTWASVGKRTP